MIERCHCGGKVEPVNIRDKETSWFSGLRGYVIRGPCPIDVMLPTCNSCGETFTDHKVARELDRAGEVVRERLGLGPIVQDQYW